MDTPRPSSEQNPSAESADLSGVSISGQAIVTARDIIGRDKIIHGDEYIGYSAAQVTVLLDKIRTEYQSKPFDGHSPYIGLASFQERDADKFFGRETLTAELVTRVAVSAASFARAVFVAGPSGSGKSSLVRAGLVPALKKGKVAGSEHWLYETLKPGRAPLDELARVVSSFANSPDAGDDLRAHARDDATRLHRWVDIVLKGDSQRRAVIVIDQFEEIFTQLSTERENERVAFLNLLSLAATVENGRMLVIFTLRSDFVSNCASHPNLNALVNQQFIQVGAMMPDELVSAIARPAHQVGLRIDPALISQIVNDVRGEPGALPLMQFALQDLFEAEKQNGKLTLDGYLARGGLRQALERHADAEFAKLDDAEKQLARSVFSGLVEIGRGREDTKRTALFGELVPAGTDATHVQALVHKLADARLITTDKQDGKETVTLAHERLIDAWDWLRRLVDENRDAIALQNEIAQDAQEWETHQRDESYLYRGARLATAQEKLQHKQLALNRLAQEFVQTAIAARERERAEREAARRRELEQAQQLAEEQKQRADEQLEANKRLRQRNLFLAGAFVLALIAVIAALFFLTQASEQRDAASQANATSQAASTRAVEQQRTAEHERANAVQAQADAEAAADSADTAAREAGRQKLLAENARATAEAEARRAEEEQRISRSRELAAIALTQIGDNSERAVLIALRANEEEFTFESEDALRRSVSAAALLVLRGPKSAYDSNARAHFSPDGTKIVTTSSDGTARVWDATTGREIALLRGHASEVKSAEFSPDSKKIVTGSSDTTARVWDALTGKALATLNGHGDRITGAEFSPDGTRILTAGDDGTARIWGSENRTEIAILRVNEDFIGNAHFSPDGTKIVTAGAHSTRIWETSTGQELVALRGDQTGAGDAEFSADGTKIVTTSTLGIDPANPDYNSGIARVYDVITGDEMAVMRGHNHLMNSAHFSSDATKVVTASYDATARIWDAITGKELFVLRGHQAAVNSAHFSPDGTKVVTASAYYFGPKVTDNTARVWDANTGEELAVFRGPLSNVNSAEFSPDGNKVITANDDGSTHVWDIANSTELASLRGHRSFLHAVQFSHDTNKIVTASEDTTARIWDTTNGKELVTIRGHTGRVWRAEFSPDDTKIVTASDDGTARLWNATSGEELALLRGHERSVVDAQFSPDGTKILTLSLDNTSRVWDTTSGKELGMLRGQENLVRSAQFSPDGTRIVTTGDNTVQLWDANTVKELALFSGNGQRLLNARFSPDSTKIVVASGEQTLLIWNIMTGKQVAEIHALSIAPYEIGFSPDGTKIATVSAKFITTNPDNTVHIWDAIKGRELVVLRGHTDFINSVQFSPDGTKIVTASDDGTVRIWNSIIGKELATLSGAASYPNEAQFSSDGSKIVAAGSDGVAYLYLVNIRDLIDLARTRVARELTCEEQVQYLREDRVCATPPPSPTP